MSVTLERLEQEIARRVGPYYSYFNDRQIPTTAGFEFAVCPELRSRIDLDNVTNLWLLRRGITLDGSSVPMDIADRQRLVSEYDPETGRVFADRPWQTIPVPGEILEFHHLDPEQQLRPALMAGLRRCYFEDMFQLQPTDLYGAIDVTAQLPWVTSGDQVLDARYGWLSPFQDAPFDTYVQGGHVFLTGPHGAYWHFVPTVCWVNYSRPAWSKVNGADAPDGPQADADTLEVDLDYAVAAGHIEAWRLFPSRLQAAAAGGMQATQQMAANEFTRQAGINGPQRPRRFGFQSLVRIPGPSSWVNGPGAW